MDKKTAYTTIAGAALTLIVTLVGTQMWDTYQAGQAAEVGQAPAIKQLEEDLDTLREDWEQKDEEMRKIFDDIRGTLNELNSQSAAASAERKAIADQSNEILKALLNRS